MATIFVQIASYRDPDLNNTLKSLFSNALYPENLRVVVANQYHEEDEAVAEYPGLEVIQIPYLQAQGACWVRNLIQQHYQGEDYTLHLDSHMRFVMGWDALLIEWHTTLKNEGHNPLITCYVPAFDPHKEPVGRQNLPYQLHFDFFAVDGWVSFRATFFNDYMAYDKPVPGRFYSGHFAFAEGAFAQVVQHDPNFYFHGEEISIGVRAFTHGYDLFMPHRPIAFHEYTRKLRVGNKRLQWDNDPTWGAKNLATFHRNRVLLGMDQDPTIDFGRYGLGTKRTLREFERYAGIKFSTRQAHPEAINRVLPGQNTETEEEWEASLQYHFKHHINIGKTVFKETDYDFWVVAYHDANKETLYRQDIDEAGIKKLLAESKDTVTIMREFFPTNTPSYWVVWPHSKSKGWCPRLSEKLPTIKIG